MGPDAMRHEADFPGEAFSFQPLHTLWCPILSPPPQLQTKHKTCPFALSVNNHKALKQTDVKRFLNWEMGDVGLVSGSAIDSLRSLR